MKRDEFIRLWADACAKGRKKRNPDMRPSDMVMARIVDEKQAAEMWEKDSASLEEIGVEEFKAQTALVVKQIGDDASVLT